ncbi:MAG: hypothetical protein WD250_16260 [Egibacteraceae bacterium]
MTTLLDYESHEVVRPVLDTARAEMARLINQARAELLASGTAVDIEQLAQGQARTADSARQWLSRRRRERRLVTVQHDGRTLVPTFQLDTDFDVEPDAAAVVTRLLDHDMDPWSIWDWAETPNTWLNGRTPSRVLLDGNLDTVDRAIRGLFQD